MNDLRKDCQMRHENGNCNVIGGFCTAVNDPICAGLHNAYDCGYCDGEIRAKREQESNDPLTLYELRKMDGEPIWVCFIDGVVMRDDGWFILAFLNATQALLGGPHPVYKNTECYGKTWLAYRQKPQEDDHEI